LDPKDAAHLTEASGEAVQRPVPTSSDAERLEDFFEAHAYLDSHAGLASCEVELAWAKTEIESVHRKMGELPRSAKAEAKELALYLQRLQSHVRRLKPFMGRFREEVERKDRHGMWVDAVTAVCGPEKLTQVMRWMADERKRRRQS
jgi:hypothetical protein